MFAHLLVLQTVSQSLVVRCSCLCLLKLSYLFFHEFLHYLPLLAFFNLSGILLGSCKLLLEFEYFKFVGLLFYGWLYRQPFNTAGSKKPGDTGGMFKDILGILRFSNWPAVA